MIEAACSEAHDYDDAGLDATVVPAALVSGAFIRFDPPELHDGSLVVRAIPEELRESRRTSAGVPLAYLYEHVPDGMPERDVSFTAGHFDELNLVWSFSGELTGISGITEPLSPE